MPQARSNSDSVPCENFRTFEYSAVVKWPQVATLLGQGPRMGRTSLKVRSLPCTRIFELRARSIRKQTEEGTDDSIIDERANMLQTGCLEEQSLNSDLKNRTERR